MISHKHKCIFVHIPKVAGQSIELYFLDHLGLTWENRRPLLLMHNTEPNIGPPKLAHLLASDYVKYHYISQDLFEEYYKFSFVRNPYDRIYSFYKFLGYVEIMTFDKFVKEVLPMLFKSDFWFLRPQYDFLYDKDGNCLVDFIGKFENLSLDFANITKKLGLKNDQLPHKNLSKSSSNFINKLQLIKHDFKFITSLLPTIHSKNNKLSYDSMLVLKDLYIKDFENFNYLI